MGSCFSSPATVNQTPSTTANISSAGVSQITNNTTTSNSSNISKDSLFSTTNGTSGEASPNGLTVLESGLRVFSYAELKAATKSFRNDTVLGEGGFGKVYKGWLDEKGTSKSGSGSVIAVKKLNSGSVQGFEEWQSEKGSLENHLFGRGSTAQPLPWETRLKILVGAARGLGFLHSLARQVIYRDFKASNILLDGSYNAKISDFGLAKLGPTESRSHVTTRVMGTQGYAAPEYVATGHLYVKSDVYAFGVVMVEILTGLRALDPNRSSGQHNLVDWIKPHLTDRRKLKSIMDSRLEGKYPSKSAIQIAQLALTCLENEPRMRPPMKDVLKTLERTESANERQREARIHSTFQTSPYRRGQQPPHHRSPLHQRQNVTRSPLHPRHSVARSPLQQRHDVARSPLQQRHDVARSPLHPRHDVNRAYPLPVRA